MLRARGFRRRLKFANRAVQCRPGFGMIYDVRADVFEARGEFRESIQDYTKVVSFRDYSALAIEAESMRNG